MSQAAGAYYQARQRELQAILKPLLENPIIVLEMVEIDWEGAYAEEGCMFCRADEVLVKTPTGAVNRRGKVYEWVDATKHEPTCPVLRKDELLR